ncbi:hypothetical protein ACFL27_00890 [candidate division CSSED10-310 bacterium]|uniref:DNA mismatch repair proteins mutS family domain-containing protein n=1 Tax=candidate division CSSED10-310 bacterium TaxID=2855610 RepID=A0ABV6YRC6_UNCC1
MTVDSSEHNEIFRSYQVRCERFNEEHRRLNRYFNRLAHSRLVLFILIVYSYGTGLFGQDGPDVVFLLSGTCALILFFIVASIHKRVEKKRERAQTFAEINDEAMKRVARQWNEFPPIIVPHQSAPPLAEDLDLFGRASIFHLVCTANTPSGIITLADWFLTSASLKEIGERQMALLELSPLLDFRQELNYRGRKLLQQKHDVELFLKWAESELWLLPRSGLIWVARLLTMMIVVIVGAMFGGISTGLPLTPLLLIVLLLNLGLSAAFMKPIHKIFNTVSRGDRPFFHYASLFEQIFTSKKLYKSTKIKTLLQKLSTGDREPPRHMIILDQIMSLADTRYSAMLHFFVQIFLLWDFHVLFFLERWQRKVGPVVRQWFHHLGEFEALCSLANLHHDHPGWCFPNINNEVNPGLNARQIGHPLLSPTQCVTNDVAIGPPGTFLLVTGSNMSGKSTILRTIGVNIILAQAGAPVFAETMNLSPLELGTSFRIRDSLVSGVSYFMAELKRIKDVVDRASKCKHNNEATFLFLFDEILLGTNVAERKIAVQEVLVQLVQQGAIGAMATHDLSLAEVNSLARFCKPVHFTEQFQEIDGEPRMIFDYVLHPGIASTTNALKLLRIVGLGQPGETI